MAKSSSGLDMHSNGVENASGYSTEGNVSRQATKQTPPGKDANQAARFKGKETGTSDRSTATQPNPRSR